MEGQTQHVETPLSSDQYTKAKASEAPEATGERLPTAERLRRAQSEHDSRLAANINESVRIVLARRTFEGDPNAEIRQRELDILEVAPIVSRNPVDESGVGVTERCVVGDGDDERIAFLKWQRGELAVSRGDEGPLKALRTLRDDGTMEVGFKPILGKRADMFNRLFSLRDTERPKLKEKMSALYGIPPEKVPLRTDIIGVKRIDVGHSPKAETAASVFSSICGFSEIPPAAMRVDRHELGSLQLRVPGKTLTTDQLADIYEQGAGHPIAPSLARLAAEDYGFIKNIDRHLNNLFVDEENGQCYGIDHGSSNGYSVPNPDVAPDAHRALQSYPADKYRSVAMEVVDDHPKMMLSQAERTQMRRIVNEVTMYVRFKEDALSKEEAKALPDHVREGHMAKLLSDTFRMLHERVDEDGNVLPETTAIAKRELHDCIARIDYLALHGRPPHLSATQHDRDSLKLTAKAHIKSRSEKREKAA